VAFFVVFYTKNDYFFSNFEPKKKNIFLPGCERATKKIVGLKKHIIMKPIPVTGCGAAVLRKKNFFPRV